MTDTSVIWKTSPDNTWRLYTHTDYKFIEPKLEKEVKPVINKKTSALTPFSFTKTKPFTKGSTACTPKGYGIIQAFHEDRGLISVKIDGQVHEFPESEVLNEIPINVIFFNETLKTEEALYTPIQSTVKDMVQKLEGSFDDGKNFFSVSLFFQGKEFEASENTIEKLKIMPWSKLLGVVKFKKPLCVKRYPNPCTGWQLTVGNIIGLSFSPSKTIRVIGFGLYKPSEGVLEGAASYCAGTSSTGDILWSKSLNFSQSPEKTEVEKVMFTRPFIIKAGEYGTVVFHVTNQFKTHYGSGAKQIIEGEEEVLITFKVPENMPAHLHGFDAGQFPELYYYV